MSNLIKWVVEEHEVTSIEEFLETFTVEEAVFNALVYSEFNIETFQSEDIIDIMGETAEYRVIHGYTEETYDASYEELGELQMELLGGNE